MDKKCENSECNRYLPEGSFYSTKYCCVDCRRRAAVLREYARRGKSPDFTSQDPDYYNSGKGAVFLESLDSIKPDPNAKPEIFEDPEERFRRMGYIK